MTALLIGYARVSPPQLAVLLLQLGQPGCVIGRGPGSVTFVDLGLRDPVAQHLRVDPPAAHRSASPPPTGWPGPAGVHRHPGRPLPKLIGVLPRCRHDSHPHVD